MALAGYITETFVLCIRCFYEYICHLRDIDVVASVVPHAELWLFLSYEHSPMLLEPTNTFLAGLIL